MVKQLPVLRIPATNATRVIRHRALPGLGASGALDALLVIAASQTAQDSTLPRLLPESARWVALQQRPKAAPLTVVASTLANRRQTAAVLGFAKRSATHFERLTLAGRMLQEVAGRRPARIGLIVDTRLDDAAAWYEALLSAAYAQSFAMPSYRSERTSAWNLRQIDLYAAPSLPLARIAVTARATNLVRWLTALPPNVLNAGAYRRILQQLARRQRLDFRWYPERELQRLGAGAFLAVSRGNAARDAGIARLRYRGARAAAGRNDLALVGKGILFDTGGTNLKPHRYMLDMHTDMAGSAVALATLLAMAELGSPLNVEAWLAISENNIGPEAYRPQDVVRAANGTTIQVIHSDAEGRMVLADTLALAARAQPRMIIDFATLTGACISALTERYSGVLTNRAALHAALTAAGADSGERVWPFPLDDDFDGDIESKIADVKQCALEGKGDHILAARFLQRFVPASIPWVHVDLASATRSGGLAHVPTEITGFGVRFALQFLLDRKRKPATRR